VANAGVFDPERILAVLAEHGVDFVLVGALAARLYGFPRLTADVDLTPDTSPDNLERLAASLQALDARVFTDSVPEGLPFDCSATTLARASMWNLVTRAGRMDVIFTPSGSDGFDDLRASAERFMIHGQPLYAASLADILRLKEAADRPQDRQDAIVIRAMLAEESGGK
jgi:hypothetical protein